MTKKNFDSSTEVSDKVKSCFYIGGTWRNSHSKQRSILTSPDTEQRFLDVPLADEHDVDQAVAAAREAFDNGPWPRMSAEGRATYLRRLAEEIRKRQPLFSKLWTAQVAAPVSFANMFIGVAPAMLDYYAGLLGEYAFEEERKTTYGRAVVIREPVGVAALITPWNAPMPILSYKLAAALAAGCTTVIKSSPETPLDTLVLAECAEAAGFAPGVINVITADRAAGAHLVASSGVDKVSFTGSVQAGKQVAKACIDRMARFTLELGGKSAAIVLEDAEISAVLPALVPVSMPFSGQICFSQTRVVVPRRRLDEFVGAYTSVVNNLVVGDPWNESTHLGPLSSARQLDRTLGYVDQAKSEGARLVAGGSRSMVSPLGYYMQPTVFTDVTPDMKIAREEVFGPVVSFLAYDHVDDAVRIANDSELGLSGTVFSADPEYGYQVARRIQTGNVSVNGLEMAPNVPFGGYKQSGLGREGGPEGLEAFLESKAIYRVGMV